MSYKGMFASDGSMTGDRKLGFAGAMVTLGMVAAAPLLTIMGANTTRSYRSTEHQWVEKSAIIGINYIIGNHGSAKGCALKLADTSWVTENMVFMVPSTGEFLFVTGVSGQTVQVQRGFGNGFVADITPNQNSDVVIQRIGTAFPEGSERPTASASQGFPKFNYTQIFRNTWAITRTAKMVDYNMGEMKPRLKHETMAMHMQDIETAILLGVRSSSYMNNQPLRSMDGIYRQIATNIASPAGGILTKQMLDTFIEVVFTYNIQGKQNRRIAVVGRHALTLISRLAELSAGYELTGRQNYFGFDIDTWVTPHGDITLMPHELLSQLHGRRSDIILLHPDALHAYFMYEGEEDNVGPNGSTGGIDGDIGGIISELTIAVKGELACGVMTGICDVAPRPILMQMAEAYTPPTHPGC